MDWAGRAAPSVPGGWHPRRGAEKEKKESSAPPISSLNSLRACRPRDTTPHSSFPTHAPSLTWRAAVPTARVERADAMCGLGAGNRRGRCREKKKRYAGNFFFFFSHPFFPHPLLFPTKHHHVRCPGLPHHLLGHHGPQGEQGPGGRGVSGGRVARARGGRGESGDQRWLGREGRDRPPPAFILEAEPLARRPSTPWHHPVSAWPAVGIIQRPWCGLAGAAPGPPALLGR